MSRVDVTARDIGAGEGEFPTQYFTDGGFFDNLGVRMFHRLSCVMVTTANGNDASPAHGVCDVILASDVGKVFSVFGPDRTPGFLTTARRSSAILMNRVWQMEREHFANARQCIFAGCSEIVSQETDPTALHPEVQLQVSRVRTDMDRYLEVEMDGPPWVLCGPAGLPLVACPVNRPVEQGTALGSDNGWRRQQRKP